MGVGVIGLRRGRPGDRAFCDVRVRVADTLGLAFLVAGEVLGSRMLQQSDWTGRGAGSRARTWVLMELACGGVARVTGQLVP